MALRRKRRSEPRIDRSAPGWEVPSSFNFTRDVIESLAARDTLRKGVAYVDTEGIVDRRTFADIAKDAARWAHLLRTRLDRGDRVLVVLGKVPAWHGAMLGALKGGLVAVPCSDMLRARDLAFRVRDSGARLVVADRSSEAEIEEMRNQVDGSVSVVYLDECFAELQRYVPRAPTEDTAAGEDALILYTSGTTKEPRGVVHSHAYTWAQRAQAAHWLDAGEDDVVWCTAGTGWAKSIWNVLLGPWSHGAEVVVHEGQFDPEQRLSLLERLGVTVLCQAPTEYRMMAKLDGLGAAYLPRLRHAVSAGEPLNPEIIERFQTALGLTIHDGYGQTENSLLVANVPETPVRAGSMGLPTPGHDVAVIDDAGHVCPPGVEGDIALRGRPPTLFSGYWNARDATEAAFRDGWYVTGDRATRDEDGYLWFVGRADDVILSAAYRIGPFEVESALLEHPAVAESAVVGVPHEERGQIVKAFVVLRAGNEGDAALATELQDHVKAITAPYKYPRAIEFVESLPKTASGKIRRSELRARPYVETPETSSVVQLPVRRRDDEAEARARSEAEARARAEAEEQARAEAEAQAAREAEERACAEAEAAAAREAEEQARAEAEAQAAREAEEQARAEAAAAAAREAEEQAREEEAATAAAAAAAAVEAARLEAEEALRRDAEERARAEADAAAEEEAARQEEDERAQAEEIARIEAEIALHREAAERARLEARAAEAVRLAAEAQVGDVGEPDVTDEAVEAVVADARPSGRAERRAARAEQKRLAAEEKRRAKEEAEQRKRDEAEARARAKEEAAAAKEHAKRAEEQARLAAESERKRARDNAAAAERRAKEEAEQRKRDEAAERAAERQRRQDEKEEERRLQRRGEFTRFLFGGGEEVEAEDDAPVAPIPGLVERLQRYSGQEEIPLPPDQFLKGTTRPAPVEEDDGIDHEIPLVEDEGTPRRSRSH